MERPTVKWVNRKRGVREKSQEKKQYTAKNGINHYSIIRFLLLKSYLHNDHLDDAVLRHLDGCPEVPGEGNKEVEDGDDVLGVDGLNRPFLGLHATQAKDLQREKERLRLSLKTRSTDRRTDS